VSMDSICSVDPVAAEDLFFAFAAFGFGFT
jgi:hypothetical protein